MQQEDVVGWVKQSDEEILAATVKKTWRKVDIMTITHCNQAEFDNEKDNQSENNSAVGFLTSACLEIDDLPE
jgi:hypothetical protein